MRNWRMKASGVSVYKRSALGNVILLLKPSSTLLHLYTSVTSTCMPPPMESPLNTVNQFILTMSVSNVWAEASDRIEQAHQHVQNAEEYEAQGLLIPAAEEHYKAAEAFQVCMEQATDEQVSSSLFILVAYILINAVPARSLAQTDDANALQWPM